MVNFVGETDQLGMGAIAASEVRDPTGLTTIYVILQPRRLCFIFTSPSRSLEDVKSWDAVAIHKLV